MIEYFSDPEFDIIVGIYDVTGSGNEIISELSTIMGYEFIPYKDKRPYDELVNDFNVDTLIVSSNVVDEDIVDMSIVSNICIFIVSSS